MYIVNFLLIIYFFIEIFYELYIGDLDLNTKVVLEKKNFNYNLE